MITTTGWSFLLTLLLFAAGFWVLIGLLSLVEYYLKKDKHK